MHNDKNKNLNTLDGAIHEAALVEAEQGTSTPSEREWDEGVAASVHARLAELRRNLVPAADPPSKARPIRPSLLSLGREALLARLEALMLAMRGGVQYAHRDLAMLSDDDLRQMIDLIEPTPPTAE